MKLMDEFYPDRPKPPPRYSDDDHQAILARLERGEAISAIALTYGITTKAMGYKIDRLIAGGRAVRGVMSDRRCLRCGAWFSSSLPKRINRRCSTCQEELNEIGSVTEDLVVSIINYD